MRRWQGSESQKLVHIYGLVAPTVSSASVVLQPKHASGSPGRLGPTPRVSDPACLREAENLRF